MAEGDANSHFFHSHAKHRSRKNYISRLQTDDGTLTSHEQKEDAIWSFYNSLIGTPEVQNNTLNLEAFYQPPRNLQDLDVPISEDQVWAIIKSMP